MYFMFGLEPSYRLKDNLDEKDIPDLAELKLIWKTHDDVTKQILRKYNEVRNHNNEKKGGKMVNYNQGDYVWVRNFNKGPKQKIQPRFMTEPFQVVKDYGYALLLRNHLGIVTQMHKNNVRKYHPRNLELYNALPFRIKLKLGSQFNQKELHKFFDELNKEEDELITKNNDDGNPIENINPDRSKIEESGLNSDESESEDSGDENDKVEGNNLQNKEKRNKIREPNLPFHMNLRKRKVKFAA